MSYDVDHRKHNRCADTPVPACRFWRSSHQATLHGIMQGNRGAVWGQGVVASVLLVAALWWGWDSQSLSSFKRGAFNSSRFVMQSIASLWYRPQAQPPPSAPARPSLHAASKPKPPRSEVQPSSATAPSTASVAPSGLRRGTSPQGHSKAPKKISPPAVMWDTPTLAALQVSAAQATPGPIVIVRAGPAPSSSSARAVQARTPAEKALEQGEKTPDRGQDITPAKGQIAGVPPQGQTLHFRSLPDSAPVIIDGKMMGKTPMTVHLPTGSHTILLEKTEQTNLPYQLKIQRAEESQPSYERSP